MNLEDLGRTVRREQELELDPVRRRAVRDRLLSAESDADASTVEPKRGWLVGALIIAAALVTWSSWPTPEQPLTFVVAGEPGARDAFVSAPLTHSTPLTFSDGSHVELARGSSARVEAVTARGATLRLEHGHADVHVVHREQTSWHVEAGPYTVHVIGTRFSVRWDARSAEFDVVMREGRVEIEGPDGFRTPLEGRERLHRTGHERVAAVRPEPVEPLEEIVAPIVEAPSPPARTSWRAFAEGGRYEDAARALPLERVVRRAERDELQLAATTLRRAGDPREAEVWLSLRERFDDPDASFQLGRHAFHRGQLADSQRWLRTYLDETPRGRWEREARGRLIELLQREDDARAVDEARSYLARFPDGPHAHLARSLVDAP